MTTETHYILTPAEQKRWDAMNRCPSCGAPEQCLALLDVSADATAACLACGWTGSIPPIEDHNPRKETRMLTNTKPLTKKQHRQLNHLLDEHLIPIGEAIAGAKPIKGRHRAAAWRVLELIEPANYDRLTELMDRDVDTREMAEVR